LVKNNFESIKIPQKYYPAKYVKWTRTFESDRMTTGEFSLDSMIYV